MHFFMHFAFTCTHAQPQTIIITKCLQAQLNIRLDIFYKYKKLVFILFWGYLAIIYITKHHSIYLVFLSYSGGALYLQFSLIT